MGAYPKATLVVQRTVHDERLERFAMPSYTYYLVLATLVVTIAAERDFRKRR
jgi:hypothetical protein